MKGIIRNELKALPVDWLIDWLIGMLFVSRFGIGEENAVDVFQHYCFHVSSFFLV